MKLLITLFGLLLIFEGLPYVACPETMQKWLQQLAEASPTLLRRIGFIAMLFGLFLCYITQRTNWFN